MNFTTMMAAASANRGWSLLSSGSSARPFDHEAPRAGPAPAQVRPFTASAADVAAIGRTNAHGVRLIRSFEGADRLVARECEGGAWELGPGVTFHLDGRPVEPGDTCDEKYAEALFRNALKLFEDGVSELVTVEINDNQFSACVSLAYNIGLDAFSRSTVLRELNTRRFDDAAEAFGMWVYATRGGYTQAYRGLLRRRYAEACLFLGYDWVAACADEAIALQRVKPASIPGKDKVVYKTALHDVLRVAQEHPLPPITTSPAVPVAQPDTKGGQPELTPQPAPNPPAKPEAKSPPAKAGGEEGAASDPTAPQPTSLPPRITVPVPPPPRLPDPPIPPGQQAHAVDGTRNGGDWSSGTKAMWQSRRFYGLVLIMAGRLWMLKTGSNAFLGAVSDPLVMEFIGGFGVMIAGEIVQFWGQRKATRALR